MSELKVFEWQDFEELVLLESKLKFPANTEFLAEKFSVEQAASVAAISIFVDSRISNEDLDKLAGQGLKQIFIRAAGFNMLDVEHAKGLGITVTRVASYSPESIAEFAVTLMLALARKLNLQREHHRQAKNGRHIDAMGFTLHGKTLGLHGYGKIARQLADIARDGFKMQVQFVDPYVESSDKDKKLQTLQELYSTSDIVSIHVPLMPETANSVNSELLQSVKPGFMLINTSRGGIVDTGSVVELLDAGKLAYFGADVWGADDKFDARLLRDNAFQADHVAFFTREAVHSILEQTIESAGGNPRQENKL
jgi:D-lactate dehydrogenase